jgi:ankyrin repeat protein
VPLKGYDAVVKLLIKKPKADVNSKDMNSQTPLLLAAKEGYKNVIGLRLATDEIVVAIKDRWGPNASIVGRCI